MFVFGLLDDFRELSVRTKFFVQIIAASLLIFFGIRTRIVYIGNPLNILITYIWVIAITNAFNLLDVLDGLSASIALLIAGSLFFISFSNGDTSTAVLALSLIGSILGFLLFNLPPARVYLGNAGSHFLGFILAATALVVRYASMERKTALLAPLFIFGLPIFDTLFLIAMRISRKRLPFKKSKDHLPLRLLALGYSKRKTLNIMLLLGLFFSVCAIVITKVSQSGSTFIIILALLLVFIITKKMSKVAVNE
ncbi:MAG: undecaprenyl/decaprenyl-phosphate alpha-N-acetylglucosaminyl 1-phosphate transferase [Candidatus Omnitrophica bacterium]|nr:undecaprenyl/decaprenyl-phosphate alpha-N-acetylglucosaminyl 1-phosphate transferase [Candidatus Omnitrophota bacterium]